MKASVRISGLSVDAEVFCEDQQLARAIKKRIEQADEQIEAAMAQAACQELMALLPGVRLVLFRFGEDEL